MHDQNIQITSTQRQPAKGAKRGAHKSQFLMKTRTDDAVTQKMQMEEQITMIDHINKSVQNT